MKQTTWKEGQQQNSNHQIRITTSATTTLAQNSQPPHGKGKKKATIPCYLPNHEINNMEEKDNKEIATIK